MHLRCVENALLPVYQTALQLSRPGADLFFVTANHQMPDVPVRSKGEAILLLPGVPQMPATIRDISASGIGIVAGGPVEPGTPVEIHVHDHAACGTVASCRADDGAFYILVALTP